MKTINQLRTYIKPVIQTVFGGLLLLLFVATVWVTVNYDVLWKTIRYPEAVRQMQIEIVVNK